VTGFWIAGIAINLVALVVVAIWAVRAWREGEAHRRAREDGDDS